MSLDAPTVAVVWSSAFAWAANVRLPYWLPILVALTVWAVYVADRLLDASAELRSANYARLHERHLFHWRHRRILAPLAAVAALASGWIIFRMVPSVVREHDSLLAAVSAVYFTRVHIGHNHFRLFSKEFLVGMLFTTGCAIPTLSRVSSYWPLAVSIAFFLMLAWLNCFAIDRWEATPDLHTNLSITLNPILLASGCLALTGSILSVQLCVIQPRQAALLLCGVFSAMLITLLDKLRRHITPVTLRATADLILLTPLALFSLAEILVR